MSAGDDPEALARRWNARYAGRPEAGLQPAAVLSSYHHLLPREGRALDLASGLGGNALYLARRGLDVCAWDIAVTAVERLAETARREGLAVAAEQRDVLRQPPLPDSFDVIVVSYFLERALFPSLLAALRPGGLLFYETFTTESIGAGGPSNPAYRLGPNELLDLVRPGLLIRTYREEGVTGDTGDGLRNVAQLVAERLSGGLG